MPPELAACAHFLRRECKCRNAARSRVRGYTYARAREKHGRRNGKRCVIHERRIKGYAETRLRKREIKKPRCAHSCVYSKLSLFLSLFCPPTAAKFVSTDSCTVHVSVDSGARAGNCDDGSIEGCYVRGLVPSFNNRSGVNAGGAITADGRLQRRGAASRACRHVCPARRRCIDAPPTTYANPPPRKGEPYCAVLIFTIETNQTLSSIPGW